MSSNHKLIEYIFFFTLLLGAVYFVWLILAPFSAVLVLAAMIVTIFYPAYERIVRRVPRQNKTLASLIATLLVVIVVVVPLVILGSFIFREAVSVYALYNADQTTVTQFIGSAERFIGHFIPGFKVDAAGLIQQGASFVATHLVSIFTATASTAFLSFLTIVSIFYLFRDGRTFTTFLMHVSPLNDRQDTLIMSRIAAAVRSVALGSIFVSILQGTMTAIGLSIFGFDRAILLGCVAALGSLIPGLGTALVYVPTVIYLIVTGQNMTAIGVALWGMLAVGLIDNFLGPYVMSKTNTIHPFLVLLSVLGGITFFGPIGFILGPVIMSLFTVLIELYADYVARPTE